MATCVLSPKGYRPGALSRLSRMPSLPPDVDEVVRRALAEDLGPSGDVTSRAVVLGGARCAGRLEARASGVIAALPVASRVFAQVDGAIDAAWRAADGDRIEPGDVIGEVSGPARSVLAAERVALNFLTHLSGVAAPMQQNVDACAGTDSEVLCK